MKPYLIPVEDGKGTPFDDTKWYKVYYDGGHHVATLVTKNNKKRMPIRMANSAMDIAFDSLYTQALKENLKSGEMTDFIQAGLEKLYPAFPPLRKYIVEKIDKKQRCMWKRIKRFKRKARLNIWNYFVTFTYDPKKHTAESFRKKLRKCLSNLHTRRNWKYMGVFEEGGENGTLHFHALLYVPKAEMVGRLIAKSEYSTKRRKRYTRYGNTFFDEAFGRSDFQELNPVLLKRGCTIKYLVKYLTKTGEKAVYSRGVPAEIYKELTTWDIAGTFFDYGIKYALFDDVITSEDVENYFKRKQMCSMRMRM